MNIFLRLMISAASFGVCWGETGASSKLDDAISQCPDYTTEQFKMTPYIELVKILQAMPVEPRSATLRNWASVQDGVNERKLHVICQMLFCQKDGSSVIRPSVLGGNVVFDRFPTRTQFYGPIAVYKNCPILIASGYRLAGMALPSKALVESCIKGELWRESKFEVLSALEERKIIDEFLRDEEWTDLVGVVSHPEFFKNQAAQAGTGQPATRPESKSEGGDKPQLESEGHTR